MMRFITPIILLGLAISIFFFFTNPIYNDIFSLKAEVASYNEALDNSKALENERDKLTAKYNAISKDDLMRLEKFLPENVDNIRLILEIEQIAMPYGMVLKDVKYNATNKTETEDGVVQGGNIDRDTPKDYGIFDLEFSTSGTYDNFISFTKDLESNLRIVDMSSISFLSTPVISFTGPKVTSADSEVYTYNFKIKTYWLKN